MCLRRPLAAIAAFTTLLLSIPIAALAAHWYVSPGGNDAGDGSAAQPWRTIAHAAAAALQPGDQVLIAPGTYVEAIALTRSGAPIVPVTTGVAVAGTDTIRFPVGTDLSGIDLAGHPGEYRLYVYRSWRANNGVFEILETGSDADGPWVRAAGAAFRDESGTAGDARYLTAAVGRPIIFRNASPDPANQRVLLDASTKPAIYTMIYIGRYRDYDDADPVDWTIVDGIDATGSHQGGGVHLQDSSFNVVMNSRFYDLQGAGILIAGNQGEPSRYNLIWNNTLYNTPSEGIYVGAGGHGPAANHAYYTHVIGNDISTQGSAANAIMENAVDLKEYNLGDVVAGNVIHDYALISQSNGAIDIRDGKQSVLIYNNRIHNIGKANTGANSIIHLYAGSDDIAIFDNELADTTGVGAGIYAFNVDGGGSSGVLIANNSVRGFNRGMLLEQYGGITDVRFANNVFDVGSGGIVEWGTAGRFTFSHNLYAANPGAYASEPGRLIANPQWLNPAAGDLRPAATSPAVDTGLELAAVALDLELTPRPSGSTWDRGAYELQAGPLPPPTAGFDAAPTAGAAPLQVQFSDRSTTAAAWSWTFGDGGSSTLAAPTHVYTAPGTYSVTLTVSNDTGGDSLTRAGLIEVAPPAARQTVLSSDFETGLAGWYRQGKVAWYAGDPKHGTHAMRFTGNNVWVERGSSTVGYRDLVLSVYLGAKSFENWEYLILYWTDGQTWYEPLTIDNHHPASDGQLHLFEVALPAAAANNPAFGIAFGMWDTDTSDFAYIDDVLVTGVPISP